MRYGQRVGAGWGGWEERERMLARVIKGRRKQEKREATEALRDWNEGSGVERKNKMRWNNKKWGKKITEEAGRESN